MKTAAKFLAAAVILGALAWTGTYLYWHIRILGAIRTLETQTAPVIGTSVGNEENLGAFDVLRSAGCRSLPYLVGALSTPNNSLFMWDAFWQILGNTLPGHRSDPENSATLDFLSENRFEPNDSAPKRQEKLEKIRSWWRESGRKYHQTWRVWSSNCGAR
ncbi:MAG: hypothetical protein HY293_22095 [Planctomycetes bacterium]|nr:hypothetical protein [Planctomycetota bacterium]